MPHNAKLGAQEINCNIPGSATKANMTAKIMPIQSNTLEIIKSVRISEA